MNVLMLSFEFPPFIVGGLGMACYGLVRALTRLGTRVNLVLPVEKACYFPIGSPGDADAPRAVLLEADAAALAVESLQGGALFHSLGLRRHPASYGPSYPYGIRTVPPEWRYRETETEAPWQGSGEQPGESREKAGEGREDLFGTMERYSRLVRKVARAVAFDVIHAHDWVTFPAAMQVKRLSGKPLLLHVHSTEYDRSPSSPDPRMCRIEEQGLRDADLVAAVSSLHAQLLIRRYAVGQEKIRVVRNAVRGAASKEETDPVSRGRRWERTASRPLVLFLGRITEQKGAMDFLRVAAQVNAGIPGVRFVMAGEGDETPRVLEAARRLGLQGCLSMAGFLDREGVAKLLSNTDVLLFPSVSDPFGISPLEAMSYGVPVVLTRQSGVSETVRNVIKCEAGDIDAMASAVAGLVGDPERRRALGERAAREANRPGWARAALETAAAYHELHELHELDVLTKRGERRK